MTIRNESVEVLCGLRLPVLREGDQRPDQRGTRLPIGDPEQPAQHTSLLGVSVGRHVPNMKTVTTWFNSPVKK